VVINKGSKKISSTVGMENSVKTSPFYPNWVTLVASEIKEIKQAIAKKDIQKIRRNCRTQCYEHACFNAFS
jgi:Mevalonate pyrophosphate decarboxylase